MKSNIYLQDQVQEQKRFTKRLSLVISVILLLAFIILLRLFYLQFVNSTKYKTLSNKNQLSIIPLIPKRGMIYDRNGIVIADNKPSYNLVITTQFTKNYKSTLHQIAKIISLSEEEIDNLLKLRKYHRPFEPITIKNNLSEKEMAKIAIHLYKMPGVQISAKLSRRYPCNEALSHIVGYVAPITSLELENVDLINYLSYQQIGKIGVEKYYENDLHGKMGYKQVEIDARGNVVQTKDMSPPKAGSDIFLSIDKNLQEKTHKIMQPYSGSSIVINIKNGEILAMVSSPSFNPNDFINGIDRKTFQKIIKHPKKPQFNRSTNGLYPLASTIKPFLAIQGLEKNIINTSYQLYDPGWYKLPNNDQVFHDISWRRGGHGWVNLTKSIIVSCDTYYYHLANLLGIDNIHGILDKFGFGKNTNIDLIHESSGLIPTPQWKKKKKNESWFTGDTLITGIGQGFIQSTPIQLAQATMLLAGKGQGYKPHLMMKIVTHDNEIVNYAPEPLEPIILETDKTWQLIHKAMRQVITHPEGTGKRFGKASYKAAGKTGTGQVYNAKLYSKYDGTNLPQHLRDHSLFIVFAPYDKPEIAAIVILENTSGASWVARQILDAYFATKSE